MEMWRGKRKDMSTRKSGVKKRHSDAEQIQSVFENEYDIRDRGRVWKEGGGREGVYRVVGGRASATFKFYISYKRRQISCFYCQFYPDFIKADFRASHFRDYSLIQEIYKIRNLNSCYFKLLRKKRFPLKSLKNHLS